jgi:hypothetical protein
MKKLQDSIIPLCYSMVVFCAVFMSCSGVEAKKSLIKDDLVCSPGLYLKSPNCVPCSLCPVNQIVRTPCIGTQDTVCGPFYEFENFQQGPAEIGSSGGVVGKDQRESLPHSHGTMLEDNLPTATVNQINSSQTKGPSVQSNEDYWRELCYGLIGALSILCLLAFVYIVVTHIRSHWQEDKSISIADPEDPTIYYRTRVFSRDRLNSTEVNIEKGNNKLWFLRKIFWPRKNDFFREVYDVDSRGLLPLHIIPNCESPDAATDRHQRLLPIPIPVHASISTDSGLSNGSSQL